MSDKEINPKYAERNPKPSGWKGGREAAWWTKSTKYGLRYKCPWCMKDNLGIGGNMHRDGCPNEVSAWAGFNAHSPSKKEIRGTKK